MTVPPNRDAVRRFLDLLFGELTNEDGSFTVGQLPIWNGATKQTTWCRALDEAADAIVTASHAGRDAYIPVALHDPARALASAQQRARERGKSQDIAQEHVRGSVDSAVALVGFWTDEDHAGGQHSKPNLPPNLAAVLEYLGHVPSPLEPSIVVDTGGGAHGWLLFREPWLLDTDEERERAASLSRRYQRLLYETVGPEFTHDSTADLARILRAPGAINTKYGRLATVVDPTTGEQVPVPEDVRRVNHSEVADALDRFAVEDAPSPRRGRAREVERGELQIGDKLPPSVLRLINGNRNLKALFEGRGKPAIGDDGRPLDSSSSGYDYSFLLELVRRGITDPFELATALACRPDGKARDKGEGYLRREVEKALAGGAPSDEEVAASVDFEVQSFRIFDSDPARYEMTVGGTTFQFRTSDLMSARAFTTRFVDATKRIPDVPRKAKQWIQLVNKWLESGEHVELPPDASDETWLRDAIRVAIENLPCAGDDEGVSDTEDAKKARAAELDRGRALSLSDGRKIFKTSAVSQGLATAGVKVAAADVCRILRELGAESISHRFGEGVVRAWALGTSNAQ